MKVSVSQLYQCMVTLLKTSTTPRKDWFWVFYTIFISFLKNPNSIFNRNKEDEGAEEFLSNYLPHSIKVKIPDGIQFIARPKYEDLARFLFSKIIAKWEPISIIKPKEDNVIVDVGANVGYYTLRLAPLVKKGKIISIEADPESCKILKTNCDLNKFSNVETHNYAITDNVGKITLYQSETHSGLNSVFLKNSSKLKKRMITVPSTTLDKLLQDKYDVIDWIKIDVEGAELLVLQGAQRTLPRVKKILIEIHENILRQNNETPEEVIALLKKNGFEVKLLDYNWDSETSQNQTLKCDYILGEK